MRFARRSAQPNSRAPTRSIGRTEAAGVGVDEQEGNPSSAQDGADGDDGVRRLWVRFGVFAAALAGAGVVLEWSTEMIGEGIGLSETAAGALLAGIATSLPELVTAVSAARAGAVDLAVGDLVGSSALDVALVAFADAFYTDGTVFALIGRPEIIPIAMAQAITALLVFGLARR